MGNGITPCSLALLRGGVNWLSLRKLLGSRHQCLHNSDIMTNVGDNFSSWGGGSGGHSPVIRELDDRYCS